MLVTLDTYPLDTHSQSLVVFLKECKAITLDIDMKSFVEICGFHFIAVRCNDKDQAKHLEGRLCDCIHVFRVYVHRNLVRILFYYDHDITRHVMTSQSFQLIAWNTRR